MKFFIETLRKLGIGKVVALSILCSGAALAQDVPVEPAMFKGDIAWMMTATLLVTFMAVPGLALFYGGLARTKNMLSSTKPFFAVQALDFLVLKLRIL